MHNIDAIQILLLIAIFIAFFISVDFFFIKVAISIKFEAQTFKKATIII